MKRFVRDYAAVIRHAAGKHGTPQWNPKPHPDADPEVVARRDSDPLWQYHRGLLTYGGHPIRNSTERLMEGRPNPHQIVLRSQLVIDPPPAARSYVAETYGFDPPDHRHTVPQGMETVENNGGRWDSTDADIALTTRLHYDRNGHRGGPLSPLHPENNAVYERLFGRGVGRRPWWDAVFPLQDLTYHAAPHDPYRLLAASVISGNRHALPHLVDLLKRRDNPAGWTPHWAALAKEMERIGDLPPHQVYRRVKAIADATSQHSSDPDGHRLLSDSAALNTDGYRVEVVDDNPFSGQRHIRVFRPDGEDASQRSGYRGTDEEAIREAAALHHDFTPFAALADHMEENGLPQYAQLMRAELANVLPSLRKSPKRKGGRL